MKLNYILSHPTPAQEYMTLKRYQNESKIPQRFQTVPSGESAAAERALYRTRDTPASGGSSAPASAPPPDSAAASAIASVVEELTAEVEAQSTAEAAADKEEEVFCLIGPKRYDVPWKVLEGQG